LTIEKVLNEKRLSYLSENPLTIWEFLNPLSFQFNTYKDEYRDFRVIRNNLTLRIIGMNYQVSKLEEQRSSSLLMKMMLRSLRRRKSELYRKEPKILRFWSGL
jgi:nicotinic acid phosphoribosyltransferase